MLSPCQKTATVNQLLIVGLVVVGLVTIHFQNAENFIKDIIEVVAVYLNPILFVFSVRMLSLVFNHNLEEWKIRLQTFDDEHSLFRLFVISIIRIA